jgi:hypothetical protein
MKPCEECGGTGRVSNPRGILGTETCLACAGQPQPGDPFPCPKCGANDAWVAHYKTPESQGLELIIGEDGTPEEGEYDGCTDSYDPDENEYYQCTACSAMVNLDGTLQAEDAA